jgi:hypothetical protein
MANIPKIVKTVVGTAKPAKKVKKPVKPPLTSLQKIEKNTAIKKNMAKNAATPAQVKAHAAEIRAMLKAKAENK